jgi:N-acetylglucosaminyl-diphospho-decaprenol L-rhamnosyltransferase
VTAPTKPVPVAASAVVPSLRGGPALERLVEALLADADPPEEVIVADNGLSAENARALSALGARVLPMGANLGFGAAVNRAAREAVGPVLVVLNDDVAPLPGLARALAEPVAAGVEMVAGVLLLAERPDSIDSAGVVVDAALGPHDYLHGEPLAVLDRPVPPPLGPCGGVAAYDLEAFLGVGGFDDGLFAYCEDVDLALRLHAAGARCGLAVEARALHIGSATLGYDTVEKARLVGYGRGYLLRKYSVLRRPGPGAAALALETSASLTLAVRHRSLDPVRARVRGWQRCRARAEWPGVECITVGVREGMTRRYVRSRRFRPEARATEAAVR